MGATVKLTEPGIRLACVDSVLVLATACGFGTVQPPQATAQPSGSPAAAPEDPLVGQLTGEVTDTGAITHLQALQKIADERGGNRAAGSPGYDASVEYVAGVLRDAGFDVSTPTYQAPDDDDKAAPGARTVIAQTRTGDPAHVVMIGAHLDSVPEGPAIVDDGSGLASVLEIATRLGVAPPGHDMVRFAFFGADQLARTGVKPELIRFVGHDESPFIKAGIPSAAPRTAMPRRRRSSRPRTGSARSANPTTAATTKPATASTTSSVTRSTTTCGHSPAPSPTSQHPPVNRPDTAGTTSPRCLGRRVGARSRRPSGPHDHRRRAANGTTAQ